MFCDDSTSYCKTTENRLRADDFNEVIAWADYCIAQGFHPGTFRKSLLAHLSHSRQRDFTLAQIDVKTQELWKAPTNQRRPDRKDYTSVYSMGTKTVRVLNFSDERIRAIKARVQQMIKQPIPEYVNRTAPRNRRKRKRAHKTTNHATSPRLLKNMKQSHLNVPAHIEPVKALQQSISVQVRSSSVVARKMFTRLTF